MTATGADGSGDTTAGRPTAGPASQARPQRPSFPTARQQAQPAPVRQATVIEAGQLFAGTSEIRLRHNGQEYRLRITSQGKLILTK